MNYILLLQILQLKNTFVNMNTDSILKKTVDESAKS